jgi:hypothetical protein
MEIIERRARTTTGVTPLPSSFSFGNSARMSKALPTPLSDQGTWAHWQGARPRRPLLLLRDLADTSDERLRGTRVRALWRP